MDRRVEACRAAMSALLHLCAKGIETLLPVACVGCDPCHPKTVGIARTEPRSVFGIIAINTNPSPTQAEVARRKHHAVQDGKLQSSRTVLRDQKSLFAVGPRPTLGSKR